MSPSPRNKTIRLTKEEEAFYLARCKTPRTALALPQALDQVFLGDAFDLLPLLPQGSVDLLIADPPYNLTKAFGSHTFSARKQEDYLAYTKSWLTLVLPLLKPTASLYLCGDWSTGLLLARALEELGLTLKNRITWQREKGRGAQKNWKNGLEDIYFATLGPRYTFHPEAVKQRRRVLAPYRQDGKPKDWEETPAGRFRDTYPSNFWDDISIPYWSMRENTPHPAQKPEKLLAKLILASSEPGQVILDPFLGSGTTAVVAKKLGRRFMGIEQEPAYAALTQRRLELAEGNSTIQGYAQGVFWERNTASLQNRRKSPKD